MPALKRSLWGGVAVILVAGGAIAAMMAMRGGDAPANGSLGAAGGVDAGVARRDVASAGGSQTTPGPPLDPDASTAGSAGEQAAQLVESGRSEAAAGHYVQAHALYQRAQALDPKPSTLFELGLMEHLTGRCRDARRTTQRVIAASPGGALAEQAQQLLDSIGRCD